MTIVTSSVRVCKAIVSSMTHRNRSRRRQAIHVPTTLWVPNLVVNLEISLDSRLKMRSCAISHSILGSKSMSREKISINSDSVEMKKKWLRYAWRASTSWSWELSWPVPTLACLRTTMSPLWTTKAKSPYRRSRLSKMNSMKDSLSPLSRPQSNWLTFMELRTWRQLGRHWLVRSKMNSFWSA